MAPGKIAEFRKEGHNWFCNAGLSSDVVVAVERVNFHLHKFPLVARSGRMSKELEPYQENPKKIPNVLLEAFPGGPDVFLIAVKFCYGLRTELTPKNIVAIHCAADYLEMTEEYDEDNLLSKCESYFHKHVLRDWKACLQALSSTGLVRDRSEKLEIVNKCSIAISTMVCTDPSLFGWPMMMYGRLQSPGGSILWNGINTGARIRSVESAWWYEDISYLSIDLFVKLIRAMESRGLRAGLIVGAIIHYAKKYLPLRRWQGGSGRSTRTITSFSLAPASVDQRELLETIIKLLPEKKGKSYCRFLLGLLRVALILNVDQECINTLERRVGVQLDLVTLDGLLIPTYSDADGDTLYDVDCAQRIIQHFLSSDNCVPVFSPASMDVEASLSAEPLKKIAKLVDNYIAEVASDVNLKLANMRALLLALPEASRSLHDGIYRGLDIYFKEHPWLSEKEKEELCNTMDYQKLSIDACAHASQNERLPIRIVLQVLYFEQMHLRSAVTGYLHGAADPEEPGPSNRAVSLPHTSTGRVVHRGGWVTVLQENRGLKVDMDRMRSRVTELEEEFGRIKQEVKKVGKSFSSSLSSPRFVVRKLGCKLLPRSSEGQRDVVESTGPAATRASVDQGQTSQNPRHRKSFSFL